MAEIPLTQGHARLAAQVGGRTMDPYVARALNRPAKSKYGNRFTEVDGIKFHSAKEARRYGELKILQAAGEIRALMLQPRFKLAVNGQHVTTYVADFIYDQGGKTVVEDVKGYKTELYKLKAKLFAAVHGFDVTEVS
jgi:hypothetical protein